MSAAEGVPVWARPVLEALRTTATDVALGHDGILSIHARALGAACAAALASDAGTPEGEPETCGCCGAPYATAHRRSASLAESDAGTPERELQPPGAAAPDAELDRELDRLLEQICLTLYHDGRVNGHEQTAMNALVTLDVLNQRAAIHAHVAQVQREAREAREALEKWQSAVLVHYPSGHAFDSTQPRLMLDNVVRHAKQSPAPAPAPGDASQLPPPSLEVCMERLVAAAQGHGMTLRDAREGLRRLYRAATGEVVGTATITCVPPVFVEQAGPHYEVAIAHTSLRLGDEVTVLLVRAPAEATDA